MELLGTYSGKVMNNEDPDEANRVKVYIPGICEPESNWANPKGVFGACLNFGMFGVPPEGTEVYVSFDAGDIDHPIYEPKGNAKLEIPEEFRGQLNKWGFMFLDTMLVFEQYETGGKIRMFTRERENFITIDGVNNTIEIKALSGINLSTTGELNINGSIVKIQGRPVQLNGRSI